MSGKCMVCVGVGVHVYYKWRLCGGKPHKIGAKINQNAPPPHSYCRSLTSAFVVCLALNTALQWVWRDKNCNF